MAVELYRCKLEWLKTGPCWKVEKALKDMAKTIRDGKLMERARDAAPATSG